MASCSFCGQELSGMPHTCNECGETHCGSHRLPERHECRGLARVDERSDGEAVFIGREEDGGQEGARTVLDRALDAVLSPLRRLRR